ncbi:hypothetical protein P5673_009229 [Acropora cervicornis]|uniref:Uncharacterized protein n=1 Tax=Acropora cervicornis TaxID=6130 RepID=A0AAD9QSJ4_ACRCE|nr:hypothetical protein P5673_009229 [Acropora cervicornis]
MNSPPSTPYTPMKSPPSTPYTPMKSPPAHTQKMNTYLDLPHPTEDYNSPLPLSVGRPFYKKRGNLYQKNSGTQRKSHEQAKPIFVNEEGGLQSQPGLLEDTFHRTTQNNTDMKSARELVLALSSPDLKISVSITEDFIGCKRFASSFTTQQSEGSITEDFIGCKRFASSFTTQQSEGSITEDFIGCKRFASSFTTQQSEGSITEDFIGCKRFASSFSSQQSGDSSQKIQGAVQEVQKSKD